MIQERAAFRKLELRRMEEARLRQAEEARKAELERAQKRERRYHRRRNEYWDRTVYHVTDDQYAAWTAPVVDIQPKSGSETEDLPDDAATL